MPRAADLPLRIGLLPPGPTASVLDVPGVGVGHATVWYDEAVPPDGRGVARTGVTLLDLDGVSGAGESERSGGDDEWDPPDVAGRRAVRRAQLATDHRAGPHVRDTRVPWWGLLSSAAAPVLLIGGWTAAAARQTDGFDPLADTVSDLAAYGATDRWVMAAALTGLGVCHVVTALSLRPAAPVGRWLLACGGVATVLVAVFPLPADDSGSPAHSMAAAVGFLTLAVWPAAAWRRQAAAPLPLRPVGALPAAVVLTGLVAWFGAELAADSDRVGLAERVAAGAQALWPLALVIAAHLWRRGRR